MKQFIKIVSKFDIFLNKKERLEKRKKEILQKIYQEGLFHFHGDGFCIDIPEDVYGCYDIYRGPVTERLDYIFYSDMHIRLTVKFPWVCINKELFHILEPDNLILINPKKLFLSKISDCSELIKMKVGYVGFEIITTEGLHVFFLGRENNYRDNAYLPTKVGIKKMYSEITKHLKLNKE